MFYIEDNLASNLSLLSNNIVSHSGKDFDKLKTMVFECRNHDGKLTFPVICSLAVLKSADIGALAIINILGGHNVMPSDDVLYFCNLFKRNEMGFATQQLSKLVTSSIDETEAALFLSQCAYYSLDHGNTRDIDVKRFISAIYNLVSIKRHEDE